MDVRQTGACDDPVALLERTAHALAFAPGPLPTLALRRIVEAGRLAPSLYNTQPFRFVVIRDRATYELFRAGCAKSRDTFVKARGIFALMNKRLNEPRFVRGLERQKTGAVLPEHGYAIVVLQDDTLSESVEACACALMSMTLEATSLGLASAFTSLVIGNPIAPLAGTTKNRRAFDDAVSWL